MAGGVLQLGVQLLALARLGLMPRIGLGLTLARGLGEDPASQRVARLMVPACSG